MIKKRKDYGFKELGYVAPPVTAKKAAALAIRRIEIARRLDVGYLVYLLQHSTILMLSGLRAQSPYMSFSPDMGGQRMTRFKHYLKSQGVLLLANEPHEENIPTASHFMVMPKTIEHLPEFYGFLHFERPYERQLLEQNILGFVTWSSVIEAKFASMMESGALPKEWLHDWWAPHNLRFGMLLGYPGVAISSALWAQSKPRMHGKDSKSVHFQMYEPDEMHGAEVGYYVSKDSGQSPEIAEHHTLWNSVIKEVIDYFATYDLEHNRMFLSEFKAYRKSRK